MYGLENRPRFKFDLERDIEKDPKMAKKILSEISAHEKTIKDDLNKKECSGEFDELALLGKAYQAASKVVSNIQ